MKREFDARKKSAQTFRDLGGEHVAEYAGQCVVCGRNVYAERDIDPETGEPGEAYDPDWRGMIGAHSLSALVASEYGKVGEDVNLCAVCAETRELYHRGLAIAFAQWQDADTSGEVQE